MRTQFAKSFIGAATLCGVVACVIIAGARPAAADDIKLTGKNPILNVKVIEATWAEIEYKMPSISRNQKIPDAEDVDEIVWTEEPASLARGRSAFAKGDYGKALSSFKSGATINTPLYSLNAQFMQGMTELEWSKQDPSHVSAAVAALDAYVKAAKPKKHFYTPHGVLALADAHIMAGDYSKAERSLGELASGSMGRKWVEAAKLKRAQVQLAQDKFREAREIFRDVQGSSNAGFALEARIGYAACQVGQQQYDGAAKTLDEVLGEGRGERNTSPPSYGDLRAKAWIVYGQAEQGAANGDNKKLQWAAYRYLRASVVAVGGGEVFAEALYRAKEVFGVLGQQDRVQSLTQRMNALCPNSPWTKR